MKQYLAAAAVLTAIIAIADTNPFNVEENLQKIDRAESVLLNKLQLLMQQKKSQEQSEEKEEVFVESVNEKNETEAQTVMQISAESAISKEKALNKTEISNSKEQEPLQIPDEQSKAEEKKIVQNEDKEFLHDLNKTGQLNAPAMQPEDFNLSKEQSEAKAKADEEYAAALRQADEEREQKSIEHSAVPMLQSEEINLSKEQSEAKGKADTQYLDAIREIDKEN